MGGGREKRGKRGEKEKKEEIENKNGREGRDGGKGEGGKEKRGRGKRRRKRWTKQNGQLPTFEFNVGGAFYVTWRRKKNGNLRRKRPSFFCTEEVAETG